MNYQPVYRVDFHALHAECITVAVIDDPARGRNQSGPCGRANVQCWMR